ncbi:two-component sensor histidine kinase [Clostridia bacterium]|nr:two-component sensor histidine kinase [Clostridia bacterium]
MTDSQNAHGIIKKLTQYSLTRQLVALISAAFTLSCAFYFITWTPLNNGICAYYDAHPEVSESQAFSLVSSLQQTVNTQRLRANQDAPLSEWARRQAPMILTVFRGNDLLYDSTRSTSSILHTHVEQVPLLQTQTQYSVDFADGAAQVMISVFPEHTMTEWASRALLLFCAIMFLGIVLVGVRGAVKRIIRLEREVLAIAGGAAEGVITRAGSDELALLAQSIDEMRCAITTRTREEESLLRERYEWTTALSHDLRTPMTALRGYIEVMLRSEKPNHAYLQKCVSLTERLKVMTDLLFSCFSSVSLPRDLIECLEGDIITGWIQERVDTLRLNGFNVNIAVSESDMTVQAHRLATERVLDNVFGNIEKYADPASPVSVVVTFEANSYAVAINSSGLPGLTKGGAGLGLTICGNLMRAMDGAMQTDLIDQEFQYKLVWRTEG